MKIHIIYLAAGSSRRFGSNKLLWVYEGLPLYRHGLDRLIEMASDRDDCTLTVVLDGKKFAYEVKGGSEPKKIVVNRRGSTVGFMIDTDKKSPVISGLTAEVDIK